MAALVIGEATGWALLRTPLERAATRAIGAPVTISEPFRLQLLGAPRLRVKQLDVSATQAWTARPLLAAQGVDLTMRWGDLWRWWRGAPLRIDALRVQRLEAEWVRMADGRSNWPPPAAPSASAAPDTPLPQFGLLQVDRGRIVVADAPSASRLGIGLGGAEGRGFALHVEGDWRALPLILRVQADGLVALVRDDEAAAAAPTALQINGTLGAATLAFNGRASGLFGGSPLSGDFQLAGPSLARIGELFGATLPQSPPFKAGGTLVHDGGVWRIDAPTLTLGSSRLVAQLAYDGRPSPPTLRGTLGGQRLALADLGPAVGVVPTARRESSGRVLPDRPFDLPSLKAMNADVAIAIDEFDFGSEALRAMRGLRADLRLQDGVLQLEQMRADLAGGRFAGRSQLDGNADPARWQAALTFDGVSVARWIPALRKADGAGSGTGGGGDRSGGDSYLSGDLDGRVDVTGAGRSTAAILGSMSGSSHFVLRNGTLSHLLTEAIGLDLAQALGVLVTGDTALPLRCAALDLSIADGVADIGRAVFDNADSTVRVRGRIDLKDETLALRLRSRPKDFSPLSLRSPLTVGGTLASPVVGIEGSQLAGKVVGAAALAAVLGPVAALFPFLDLESEPQGDPCRRPSRPNAAAPAPSARPAQSSTPASRPAARAAARSASTAAELSPWAHTPGADR